MLIKGVGRCETAAGVVLSGSVIVADVSTSLLGKVRTGMHSGTRLSLLLSWCLSRRRLLSRARVWSLINV